MVVLQSGVGAAYFKSVVDQECTELIISELRGVTYTFGLNNFTKADTTNI